MNGCRPLRELLRCVLPQSWGSAALHPRLYAIAALRGLKANFSANHLELPIIISAFGGVAFHTEDNNARRSYSSSINPVLGTGCADSCTVKYSCASARSTSS